jgi:hypothetical protein
MVCSRSVSIHLLRGFGAAAIARSAPHARRMVATRSFNKRRRRYVARSAVQVILGQIGSIVSSIAFSRNVVSWSSRPGLRRQIPSFMMVS